MRVYLNRIRKTSDRYMLVDKQDYDFINQFNWTLISTGPRRAYHYAIRKVGKLKIYAHRLIMDCPKDMFVDHINHNTLDNRRANLRIVTRRQNNTNSRPSSIHMTSKYKGVYRVRSKFRSTIILSKKNKKRIHLGYFSSEEEAAIAYNKAAKKYFGAHAFLNKVKKEKICAAL